MTGDDVDQPELMDLIHQHLTTAGIDCPDTSEGALCHDLAVEIRMAGWVAVTER